MKNNLRRDSFERDLFREALSDVMAREEGRKLIYILLSNLGEGTPLYYGGSAETFAFIAGRRSVADELLMNIRALDNGLELEVKMRYEARAKPKEKQAYDDCYNMTGGEDIVL